eukprot:3580244-Prymnesium_polylepis.1
MSGRVAAVAAGVAVGSQLPQLECTRRASRRTHPRRAAAAPCARPSASTSSAAYPPAQAARSTRRAAHVVHVRCGALQQAPSTLTRMTLRNPSVACRRDMSACTLSATSCTTGTGPQHALTGRPQHSSRPNAACRERGKSAGRISVQATAGKRRRAEAIIDASCARLAGRGVARIADGAPPRSRRAAAGGST